MTAAEAKREARREGNLIRVDFALARRHPSDYDTARLLYHKASALDEDPATMAEAATLYESAIALDPSFAIAYTNLGNVRVRQGDERSGERLYRHALSLDETLPEAHYNLGYLALEAGQPEKALVHLRNAIAHDPAFADAHFNVGQSLAWIGDVDGAIAGYEAYLKINPHSDWADRAREEIERLRKTPPKRREPPKRARLLVRPPEQLTLSPRKK